MTTQPTKGPYTLGGTPTEVIAGVTVPGLVFRDNDGTLAIMAPADMEERGTDRIRIAGVSTMIDVKRGTGHKLTFEDDPEQAANARLFMAAPVLYEHREEIVTALNMMVNEAQPGRRLDEAMRVRDTVYAALVSVTGDETLEPQAPTAATPQDHATALLAMEWGYRACEKGKNLQLATKEFIEILEPA